MGACPPSWSAARLFQLSQSSSISISIFFIIIIIIIIEEEERGKKKNNSEKVTKSSQLNLTPKFFFFSKFLSYF